MIRVAVVVGYQELAGREWRGTAVRVSGKWEVGYVTEGFQPGE